jgi:hypothetical protein
MARLNVLQIRGGVFIHSIITPLKIRTSLDDENRGNQGQGCYWEEVFWVDNSSIPQYSLEPCFG